MNGDTKKYLFKYVSIDEVKNNTDKVSFKTLVELVEYWSFEKELHKGNSFVQLVKFFEESGEVAAALCRDNRDALRDGIGDVVVTLVILAQQNNMTLQECLEQAYGEIKDRTGVMSKDGSFIKSEDIE
ncbi:MazG-like family protein [Staphylococcus warneri]|nr:MazG-like family protein [Staphylococcus warneri]MCD8806472.1 MazG-like family protein [Staphylococcus warneri]